MVKIMSTLLTAWTRRPLAAADSLLKHALPLRLCLAAGGMLLLSLDPVACRAAEMAFPGEQWEIASPASQGIDGEKLAAAVDYLTAHAGRDGTRELIIIRNGRQVLAGDNVDKVHGIWSCTKSFSSTVLGLLIDDGRCTLDTPAQQFVPELAGHYPQIRL